MSEMQQPIIQVRNLGVNIKMDEGLLTPVRGVDFEIHPGETLGLGMKAPATSWGVLLKETEDLVSVAQCPWKMIPLIFVVITVLAFNFLGDGLRDAADPYK